MVISATQEMVLMQEPTITELERSLNEEEKRDLRDMTASGMDFVMILVMDIREKGSKSRLAKGLPPSVGSF